MTRRVDHDALDLQVLTDPTTGRPILMAPKRRARPHLTGGEENPSTCPLCPGHEHETPAEVDAVRAPDTAPDTPGWRVRAVPNLYPAARHHEVIAEGAEHEEQPGRLSAELWTDAVDLHRRRIAHMETQPGVTVAFVFKNVGLGAGASLVHNHTQILGLPMLPPRLVLEREMGRGKACLHCAEIESAEREGRVVVQGEHHVVLCPRAPKLPYETWLLPLEHDDDLLSTAHIDDLGKTLHALFRALDGGLDAPPFNLFLHRIGGGEDFHWHYEVQPRTGTLAGLEIGADMYINVIPAAESAAVLRSGSR